MFFNENVPHSQESLQNNKQLSSSILNIEKESTLRVDILETLIIQLEKEIMDENDFDESDELRRKELRPLTRDLMNQMKIDRNLTKLMLQEIKVATSGTNGVVVVSDRFKMRFTNVVNELATIQLNLTQIAREFAAVYPGVIEKHLLISDLNPVKM